MHLKHLRAPAVLASLLACASRQVPQHESDANTPDASAIVVRFESAGNVLDGLQTRIAADMWEATEVLPEPKGET